MYDHGKNYKAENFIISEHMNEPECWVDIGEGKEVFPLCSLNVRQ